MKDHGTQRPERMRDPYIGKWRWVRVGCEWCGVQGRHKTKAEAQVVATRHNRGA